MTTLAERVAATLAEAECLDCFALAFPVRFRYGRQIALWSWHLVVVLRRDGRVGVGTAPGYSGDPVPTLKAAQLATAGAFIERGGSANPVVRAAFDTAALDLLGWERAGLAREPILLEGMIWFGAPPEVRTQAEQLRHLGFTAAKLKLSGDVEADVGAVREALRHFESSELRVDANRAYGDWREAGAFAERYAALGCEWIEEPSPDWRNWRQLTDRFEVRCLGDESFAAPAVLDEALASKALDGLNVKLARVGGPVEALDLVARAEACDVQSFVGCSEDIGSGMSAIAHVASVAPSRRAEGWGSLRLEVPNWDRFVRRFVNGHLEDWTPLGETRLSTPPSSRGVRVLRATPAGLIRASAVRVSQALANRALRAAPRRRPAATGGVLSPELGWQRHPNLGGAVYERGAVDAILAHPRSRVLLPASEAEGLPCSYSYGRLWLPRWNRPLVLAMYGPLQFAVELLRYRPSTLRLHSISHLGPPGLAGAALARRFGWEGAVVGHVHHLVNGTTERDRGRHGHLVDRLILRRLDRVIVPSRATEDALVESFGLPRERIVVVPNALRDGFNASPAPRRTESEKLRALFVGQLIARKRPLDFVTIVESLAARRSLAAKIVGSGSLETELVARTQTLDVLQHVRFEESLTSSYEEADVLVCTSTDEGFYYAGLEAMHHGCVVVGYAIPALKELVGKELEHLLVERGDVDSIVGLLAELGSDELATLSALARRRASRFTPDAFRDHLLGALVGESISTSAGS